MLKKKKKAVAANEGERLASGTMHAGPTGTAVNDSASPSTAANTPVHSPADVDTTPIKKKKKKVVIPENPQTIEAPSPRSPVRSSPGRNQEQSPSASASASRAAGLLHKQPSIVKEDPEAEDLAEKDISPVKSRTPMRSVSVKDGGRMLQTSGRPAMASTQPHQRAVSLDIPRGNGARTTSISPPRNAHFSDVIETPVSRHYPPPRSVSPFKSALKHSSPTSSVRATSPGAGSNGTRPPPSDTSDTVSLGSQDGIKVTKKPKKSVRVSFDDGGTTVSPATEVTPANSSKPIRRELSSAAALDSDNDEVMTPRPVLPSFGSVRARRSHSPPELTENGVDASASAPSTYTGTSSEQNNSSSDHALGTIVAGDLSSKKGWIGKHQELPLPPKVTSIDGSGYASDSSTSSGEYETASRQLHETEPASTEQSQPVTTDSGPIRTEQVTPTRHVSEVAARVLSAPVVSGDGSAKETTTTNGHIEPLIVPDISVQPATPGIEEDKPILDMPGSTTLDTKHYSIPGGWDESEESKSEPTIPSNVVTQTTDDSDLESSDDENALEAPLAAAERHSPSLDPIYESDSDDAFSDAAEDLTDTEGGFASLDAIVESPVQPTSRALDISTPPDSPSSTLPPPNQTLPQSSPLATTAPITATDGDWNEATAYWSSLTRERKEQLERQAAVAEDVEASVLQDPNPKKRSQPSINVLSTASEPAEAPLESPLTPKSSSEQFESRYPILKKSMRTTNEATVATSAPAPMPTAETRMRKSMRPTSAGGMKTSMREDPPERTSVTQEPKGALQKKQTSIASSAGSTGAAAAAVKKSAPRAPAPPSIMTNDSDSESSFRKKKRRGSVSAVDSAGRYNMKRSMRGSSVDTGTDRRASSPTVASRGSGRLSIRSLSPNGSFMGRNRENLRASIAGGRADDTPTLRGKNSRAKRDAKSPTRFSKSGFSKTSRPSSAMGASAGGRSSRGFKSRFNDSDDEDEPSFGTGFRSRFADSDDEDEVPVGQSRGMAGDLRPVRGIPRRHQDDDSTDLEDSEEEAQARPGRSKKSSANRTTSKLLAPSQADMDAAMAAARRNVAAMNGHRNTSVDIPPEPDQRAQLDAQPQSNGVATATPVPSTPTKKRGLLGNMLGRRRSSSVATMPQMSMLATSGAATTPSSTAQSPMPQSPNGKLQRRTTRRANSTVSAMSFGAPRVPTTQEDFFAEQPNVSTPGGMSIKSQNWPLPPQSKIVDQDRVNRPATSDGVEEAHTRKSMGGIGSKRRPEIGRRSMSGGDLEKMTREQKEKTAVYSERTGRKKKFPFLRKVFGLND